RWGAYSLFSNLRALASNPNLSRQAAWYFVCPRNSFLKNSETVDSETPARWASLLLPMGAKFRQLPSAYLWCLVKAAMILVRASPLAVLRFGFVRAAWHGLTPLPDSRAASFSARIAQHSPKVCCSCSASRPPKPSESSRASSAERSLTSSTPPIG